MSFHRIFLLEVLYYGVVLETTNFAMVATVVILYVYFLV